MPAEPKPAEPNPEPATFSEAFASAVRGAGIAKVTPGEAPQASALLAAVGGVRGLIESIVPGLGFLVVYTVTQQVLPSVVAPLALAVVFLVVRILTRSQPSSAITGVLFVALSAGFALWSGKAEDNFVLGFVINGVSLLVLLVSLAVRWPFIGLIVGALTSDPTGWRSDPAKVRVFTLASWLWVGLFVVRLGVELPLYFAHQAQWLGATKLLLGVPLYAAMLWVTWLLVRAVYARPQPE